MTETEGNELVRAAAEGDDHAFVSIMETYRTTIFYYLRGLGMTTESAEDTVQDTVLRAYRAIRNGQYEHHNLAAFGGWLRIIARRAMLNQHAAAGDAVVRSLDEPGPAGVAQDYPDSSADPAAQVEQLNLFGFLERQLDEALIHSQTTPEKKKLGLLRKLAFLRFYVDQRSQKEIMAEAIADAAALGILNQVTPAAINNWISRGDILKTLVQHLVATCPHSIFKLSQSAFRGPDLSMEESEVLELEWDLRLNVDEIARKLHLQVNDVSSRLSSAKRKIAGMLFKVVKEELHEMRFRER